ncbi:MAG: hypothetical protein QM677_00240 [Microbacterium sp.]
MTVLEGIATRIVDTGQLTVTVLERPEDDVETLPDQTIVFIHGSDSSTLFWQELMQDLPGDLRVIAIDLDSFSGIEGLPADASHGVRERSDDIFATLTALGIETAHLVGGALGGPAALQYAIDHPVLSLTLETAVAPHDGAGSDEAQRLTDLTGRPPILWAHGLRPSGVAAGSGAALSDAAARDALEAYRAAGGDATELTPQSVGGSQPAEFRRALLEVIGYIGRRADPAPPTEAIILSSWD